MIGRHRNKINEKDESENINRFRPARGWYSPDNEKHQSKSSIHHANKMFQRLKTAKT